MPYTKILIHAVWCTKKRKPLLSDGIRQAVIEHISKNAQLKGISIDCINGYLDHLHCLFWMHPDVSIAKAMNLIKGESAFWINKEKITPEYFEWADEYYAASVSDSNIRIVRKYIKNQEIHHSKKTLQDEHEEFLKRIENLLS